MEREQEYCPECHRLIAVKLNGKFYAHINRYTGGWCVMSNTNPQPLVEG